MKKHYSNCTRKQIVEVVAYTATNVFYRVIESDIHNSIKEFNCTKERFLRLYI